VKTWFALFAMLLSLTTVRAQVVQRGPLPLVELTPEQKAECIDAAISRARRSRECDNTRGCYFNAPPEELALNFAEEDAKCRLQRSLQRLADDVLKKLEEEARMKREGQK